MALAGLLLLALPALPAAAQEDIPERVRAVVQEALAEGVVLRAPGGRAVVDAPEGRLALTGPNAELIVGDPARPAIHIYADGIVLWGEVEPGGLIRAGMVRRLTAVYAEGDVHLSLFGDSVEGDALLIDMEAGVAHLLRARLRAAAPEIDPHGRAWLTTPQQGSLPLGYAPFEIDPDERPRRLQPLLRAGTLLVRAERARVSDMFRRFEAEDVEVSTCTFGEPHWSLRTDSVRADRRVDLEAPDDVAGFGGARIRMGPPRLRIGGRTVLGFPAPLLWDTDWNPFVPRIDVGRSRRFGAFIRSSIPVYPGEAVELRLLADYMDRRGPALGSTGRLRARPAEPWELSGYYEVYGVRDRARRDISTDQPFDDRERWRAEGLLRIDRGRLLRGELEVGAFSDPGFLLEHFESAARVEKEQETAAYARVLGDQVAATLLARTRLNDFQDQVEYLPRGRFFWIGTPLLDEALPPLGRGLYLSLDYQLSNARRRFAGPPPPRGDTRVLRADLDHRLDYPVPLGPVQVVPFGTGRVTAFSEGIDPDDAPVRTAFGTGATATTDLWKDFAFPPVGFAVLRHVLTPGVGYERLFHVDVDPDELIPIDATEELREREEIFVSLRNRLLGITADRSRELIDLDLRASFFPRPRLADGRRRGLLRSDLRLRPGRLVRARAKSDWDLEDGARVATDVFVAVEPLDRLALFTSYRFRPDLFDAWELGFDLQATVRWGLGASGQYDLERDDFIGARLSLRRTLHRFMLEGTVEWDRVDDDVRFSVGFLPLELFATDRDLLGRRGALALR